MKKLIPLITYIFISMTGYNQNFPPPSGISFYDNNDSAYITWQSPESKDLSHYNVLLYAVENGKIFKLGSTIDTHFTIALPTFFNTMNFGVSAEYNNPIGVSDTIWVHAIVLWAWGMPIYINFEDPYVYRAGLVANVWEGNDNWELTDTTYYSSEHCAAFYSDSVESRSSLITTYIAVGFDENPKISFQVKIPENMEFTDTLKLFYYTSTSSWIQIGDPLLAINNWQLAEYSLESLPNSFHLGFEATCGGGYGIYIDDIIIENDLTIIPKNFTNDLALTLFPNPATSLITIQIKESIPIEETIIYNHLGQKVLVAVPVNNTMDVSMLKPGMYFIEVAAKDWRGRTKLIKQ